MTRFKICGLRDSSNALVAAESGADLVGFCFVEGVRRQLLPEQAAAVIAEFRDSVRPELVEGRSTRSPAIVGLFANQSAQFVNEVTRLCGLDYVQLCGDETPDMWDLLDVPVIRQVKVREDLPRGESLDIACRQVQLSLIHI